MGTLQELERAGIVVDTLVLMITALPAPHKEPHKQFLKEYTGTFLECKNPVQVFVYLNSHWDYLNSDILSHIITGFSKSFSNPSKLTQELAEYRIDLTQFLNCTTLKHFCEAEDNRQRKCPSTEFIKLVSRHQWAKPVFLKQIDNFRKEFAYHYSLRDCAIYLRSMRYGSVVITMSVPKSIEGMINVNTDIDFFRKHRIVHLHVGLTCVYSQASKHFKEVAV